MSRQNKVNKGNYDQAGRLTPDDMARERQKQGKPDRTEQVRGAARTFLTAEDHRAKAVTVRGKRGQESTRARSAPEE